MRIVPALAALALVLLCMAGPARAQGGLPGEVVRAEILGGWVTESGTRIVGLRLSLAPGWRTYWSVPGDAGIPPQFDWSGSDNLVGVRVHWPAPTVFETYGMRTAGYA